MSRSSRRSRRRAPRTSTARRTPPRPAFETWGKTTPQERSPALLKLADAIEARADELGRLESKNAGKPVGAAIDEIPVVVDNLRFFAGAARLLEGKAANEYMADHTSFIRREPVGVVASIAPWNYPIMMAGWKIGPALAAGNTVILKPSVRTPLTALVLAEIAADILPPGVLNVITGTGARDRRSARRPSEGRDGLGDRRHGHRQAHRQGRCRQGQAAAPRARRQGAGHHLRRRRPRRGRRGHQAVGLLERRPGLHGRHPRHRRSRRSTTTSWPTSPTQVKSIKWGDPAEGDDIEMGSLIADAQADKVEGMVDRARARRRDHDRRRRARTAPAPSTSRPSSPAPTRDSEIVQDEVFGPVVTVQRFSDEDQAIKWANDVRFGLAASVWTADAGRGMRVAKAIQFGTVWINDHFMLVSEMPHGGFKESGYGKDQSMYAVEDYTVVKHVMLKI